MEVLVSAVLLTTIVTGCGTVAVHGNYSASLTIASDDDIIVDSNGTMARSSAAPSGRRSCHACGNDEIT